ncbi:MAG: hypothetical protein ACREO1_01180 [Arenimonas sp.]
MGGSQMAAILLIIAGAIGLAIGSFSYTKNTEQVKLGPIELSVKEKQTVNIPVWLGGGAVLVGVFLLIAGKKK